MKEPKRREPLPTGLSWEEKNSMNYIYKPSSAVMKVRESRAGKYHKKISVGRKALSRSRLRRKI
jgi:hypothetical protein